MIIYDDIPNKAITISYSIIKVYHLIALKYRDHVPNEQFQSCLIFWSESPLCRKKKHISPWPIADVSHGDFSDLGVQFQKK
jgi:hypothetical protein